MYEFDISTWKRKKHYEMFSAMKYPLFNVCANVDITYMLGYAKQKNLSFFKLMVYYTSKIANEIEEFRYRIKKDTILVHDYIHPSFTVLGKDETFGFCLVEYNSDKKCFFEVFDRNLQKSKEKPELDDPLDRDDLIYVTCLPWISFTSIQHPIELEHTDSIPRIAWGKYFNENGRWKVPLSIQVNHALMDGFHVGKYFNNLQQEFDNLAGEWI